MKEGTVPVLLTAPALSMMVTSYRFRKYHIGGKPKRRERNPMSVQIFLIFSA